jgi:hypothetical protein
VPPPVEAVADLPALGGTDREMITRAFESLPDQWQVPLWHTTIVGTDLPALAPGLGVPAGAARPLARYAGRKLRQAYLQAHLDAAPRPGCEPHRELLAAHLGGALDTDADAGVRSHLERCDSCRELVAGLSGVDELLARSVVPFFPVAAGPSGVPTPLGAPGSAATEVTGEGPVLDVSPSPSPAAAASSPGAPSPAGAFSTWWRRRRNPPDPIDPTPVAAAGHWPQTNGHPAANGEATPATAGTPRTGWWHRAHGHPPTDGAEHQNGGAGGHNGPEATAATGSGHWYRTNGRTATDGGDPQDGAAGGAGGRRGRGRRVGPALGGAAAATVFVVGLAVFGTRLVRDDSARGADGAPADEAGGRDTAVSGQRTSGSDGSDGSGGGREGTSDRTTTTVARDDRRPPVNDEHERIEPVPRRGDSAAASASAPGSTTGSSATRETTGTTAGRGSPPATSRPPGSTTTTTPPRPPALASWSVGWSAAAGSGTLRVTVTSPSGSGAVDTHAVVVTVGLTAGAHVASADGPCTTSAAGATCTVPAPGAGDSTTVSIGLTVDGPGESATVSARQGGSALGGAQQVALDIGEAAS